MITILEEHGYIDNDNNHNNNYSKNIMLIVTVIWYRIINKSHKEKYYFLVNPLTQDSKKKY